MVKTGGIKAYISTRRGVGHTTLMKEGVKNYDKPFFVLGANKQHSLELMTGVDNKNAIPLGLNNLNRVNGVDYPMIIDAFVVQVICDQYEDEIMNLRSEHYREMGKEWKKQRELQERINEMNRTILHNNDIVRKLQSRIEGQQRDNNRMSNYVVGVNKKVKDKFLGMSLFNRIFRYNKTLEKKESLKYL